MSVYCFHVDPLGRPSCVTDSVWKASQGANFVNDVTRLGINGVVRRLCCVDPLHTFDNHDVNYDFVYDRGPM